MSETASVGESREVVSERNAVAFLLPSYKTPLLASELLHAAASVASTFVGCSFVLLLDSSDTNLPVYFELVKDVRAKGLTVGYIVFDGAPYCGCINRVAPIVAADTVCVLDNKHLPSIAKDVEGGNVAAAIRAWLKRSPQQMQVGTFTEDGFFPVVTQKLIERLGYMFHPLCYGRLEAENWILSVAESLDVLSPIPGGSIIESPAETIEFCGSSSAADMDWVADTLAQTLDEVVERLDGYLEK